jgi:hypothetical protein
MGKKINVVRVVDIRQLLDFPTSLKNLAATDFRISERLIAELLAEDTAGKLHLDP